MEILTNDDAEYYLQNGKLTSPFLSNEFVLEKVMIDYNYRIQHNMEANIICSLYNWISYNVKYIKDKEQRVALKFQRTAKEIGRIKLQQVAQIMQFYLQLSPDK